MLCSKEVSFVKLPAVECTWDPGSTIMLRSDRACTAEEMRDREKQITEGQDCGSHPTYCL